MSRFCLVERMRVGAVGCQAPVGASLWLGVLVQVLATSSGWDEVLETPWPSSAGHEEPGCGAGHGHMDRKPGTLDTFVVWASVPALTSWIMKFPYRK